MTTLTAVLVNYNVAHLVVPLVRSLAAQPIQAEDGSPGDLEIVLVDNGSAPGDRTALDEIRGTARLLFNAENVGFGVAVNRAAALAAGRYLCILNPDTALFPGALQELLAALYRDPRVAAVGPKFWWDDDRTMRLPPIHLPTLGRLLAVRLAQRVPAFGRAYRRRRTRLALRFWRLATPTPVTMLSGACVVVRRSVVDEVGLYDPGFPFYYEDADWFRRVRRAGHRILYVPSAEVAHYYNQSARQNRAAVTAWHAISERHYFVKHYGRPGEVALGRVASRLLSPSAPPPRECRDLGVLVEPPVVSLDGRGRRDLVFQIGHHWLFLDPFGAYPVGETFPLPRPIWDRLAPGRYFARYAEARGLRTLGVWTWVKA